MFYSIKGTLTHMEPGFVVVECAGVGFKCLTTLSTQRTMPQIGEQVKLFTHLNVREDAMDLFGFATMMELNCFKMLTAVSGVGARTISSLLNFFLNKKLVFRANVDTKRAMLRYYALALPQMAAQVLLTQGAYALFAVSDRSNGLRTVIYALVMIALYFLSYMIQQRWVFAPQKSK